MVGSIIEDIASNDNGTAYLIPIDLYAELPKYISTPHGFRYTILAVHEVFSILPRSDGKKLCAVYLHESAIHFLGKDYPIYYY